MKQGATLTLLCGIIVFMSSCASLSSHDEHRIDVIYGGEFAGDDYGLNTFKGTYVKQVAEKPYPSIPMHLTAEEEQRLIDTVNDVDFWTVPEKLEDQNFKHPIDPGLWHLRIKMGSHDKTVWWHYQNWTTPETFRVYRLARMLNQIIWGKPEYFTLPGTQPVPARKD